MTIFLFLSIFWFIRTVKTILFWLYLWQLKEYHIGRFLDHFRTYAGRRAILNRLLLVKVIVLFLLMWGEANADLDAKWFEKGGIATWFVLGGIFVLFLLYSLESIKGVLDFLRKQLRVPVFTGKITILTILLVFFAGYTIGVFIFSVNFVEIIPSRFIVPGFLTLDIFMPLFVSAAVLALQPFAVFARNRTIAKARKKRDQFSDLLVIGITGSYGKTSTKEFLAHILSKKFKVLKTKEHQNSEVGISNCILQELKPEHEVFVCEMGAYNKGGIKLLARIARPDIAILTGANEQHLATFGSMENLLSAEGGQELVEALSQDGIAVFNGDNLHTKALYQQTKTPRTKILCSSVNITAVKNMLSPYVWAENLNVEKESFSFDIVFRQGRVFVTANLLGGYNVMNLLLAAAVARELGMTLEEIAAAIGTIPQEIGAMRLRKGIDGLNIIDSTYSANPDGVVAALEYLKIWPGKKILVMPCLIELGRASKEVHKRIGEKIGEVCDLAIITTKDRVEDIQEGVRRTGKAVPVLFLENPQEIVEKIKSVAQAGDTILLEGRIPSQAIKSLV